MEVPEKVAVAVSPDEEAERTLEPGAKTSTQRPQLEKYDISSDDVVEPTVIASGARAGE